MSNLPQFTSVAQVDDYTNQTIKQWQINSSNASLTQEQHAALQQLQAIRQEIASRSMPAPQNNLANLTDNLDKIDPSLWGEALKNPELSEGGQIYAQLGASQNNALKNISPSSGVEVQKNPVYTADQMDKLPKVDASFQTVPTSLNNNLKMIISGKVASVECYVDDLEMSVENQYASPFSESNPEQRLSSLYAGITSGVYSNILNAGSGAAAAASAALDSAGENLVTDAITDVASAGLGKIGELSGKLAQQLQKLEGRSSFTKVNSQQLYGSTSPVRISGSLTFVAMSNAANVERAVNLLYKMAAPEKLFDGAISQGIFQQTESLIVNGGEVDDSILRALFPSVAPAVVSISYGGRTYKDFYVESLSSPLSAPMNQSGHRVVVKVQASFVSKKAWDIADWAGYTIK